MKYFDWDDEKNSLLKKTRNVSFEQVIFAISSDKLLDIIQHPNNEKYPNQRIFVVEINGYVHLVPFVEDEKKYFLKTIYPSREATKKYLNKEE